MILNGQYSVPDQELGVFRSRQDALRAFRALLDAGFRSETISLKDEPASANSESDTWSAPKDEVLKSIESSGWVGAVSGALVGAVLCELGRIASPDLGFTPWAGPLAAAAIGVIAGAAIGGSVGALIGSLSRSAAERQRDLGAETGGATVVLKADARSDMARTIIRAAGGAI
jgi:hypothetical protein